MYITAEGCRLRNDLYCVQWDIKLLYYYSQERPRWALSYLPYSFWAAWGLRGCKNGPAPFPGRMSYKVTKPGLVCLSYLSMLYYVLWFIRAPFYVFLVFVAVCSVFWLFWLSCHYLSSDWLERPLWGSIIVARGWSP